MGIITVLRVKKRFKVSGMNRVIHDRPGPVQPKKYSTSDEAKIIALACSTPLEGKNSYMSLQ